MTDEVYNDTQELVDSLSIDEAKTVYKLIATRLNAIQHLHEAALLQKHQIGDRVAFHSAGRHIEGLIVRVNLRTVSVVEDSGKRWAVAPQYLSSAITAQKIRGIEKKRSKTKAKRRKKR